MEKTATPPDFYTFAAAVEHDKPAAAEMIARFPELVALKSSIGETALHYLVIENDIASAQFLIERGADVNTRNKFAGTPLMDAAKLGLQPMCRFLIENGATIDSKDHNGCTAISMAAREHLELLKYLMTHISGSDINTFFSDVDADILLEEKDNPIAIFLKQSGLKPRYDV
jgi:ankyrin repeat protein